MIALVSGSDEGLLPMKVSAQLSRDPSAQVKFVTPLPQLAGKFLFRSVPLQTPKLPKTGLGLLLTFFLHILLDDWETTYLV